MSHTQPPFKVECNGDGRTVYITTEKPVIEGARKPLRIATMAKIKGFAGNAKDNAKFIVMCCNAWMDPQALRDRLAELENSR